MSAGPAAMVDPSTKSRKLNLGCGAFPKPGYVNVDHDRRVEPDVTHDLNTFPYPFEDGRFSLIEAYHVLEHLDDPFQAMRELHRMLSPGGRLVIRVPHFSRGFTHPEHKRGFDVSFPYYFQPSFPGGYMGVPFKILRVRLRWFAQPYLKKRVMPWWMYGIARVLGWMIDPFAILSPMLCSRVWCFLVGGFEEIEFHFIRASA